MMPALSRGSWFRRSTGDAAADATCRPSCGVRRRKLRRTGGSPATARSLQRTGQGRLLALFWLVMLDSRGPRERRQTRASEDVTSLLTAVLSRDLCEARLYAPLRMADFDLNTGFIPALHKPASQLPIAKHRESILYLVETYPVVVVVGQTGSGKTTQIPQFLDKAGWTADGKVIAITQVRTGSSKPGGLSTDSRRKASESGRDDGCRESSRRGGM